MAFDLERIIRTVFPYWGKFGKYAFIFLGECNSNESGIFYLYLTSTDAWGSFKFQNIIYLRIFLFFRQLPIKFLGLLFSDILNFDIWFIIKIINLSIFFSRAGSKVLCAEDDRDVQKGSEGKES